MLDINNNLNSLDLPLHSILVRFDAWNMFQNIDNNLALFSVKKYLDWSSKNILATNGLSEALFNYKKYLSMGSTAQEPHILCSYADIALTDIDEEVL